MGRQIFELQRVRNSVNSARQHPFLVLPIPQYTWQRVPSIPALPWPDAAVSHRQSDFLCCDHVFNHLPNYRFRLRPRMCRRLAWMVILHGSPEIFMAHCPHPCREIAGVA